MRKNLDSRNASYVKKLSKNYNMPVKVIQTSNNINSKELNQALDICEETGAKIITINAPEYLNLKAYNFILDNLANYRKHNQDIKFSIINPEQSNFFALPIPKYRFTNVIEIIKKYGSFVGLDIVHLEEEALENEFLRKLKSFIPHLSVIYFSDKTRAGEGHVLPGDGTLKLPNILKKFKKELYPGHISLKVKIKTGDLADTDKALLILKKATTYFKEHYTDVKID